MTAVEDSPAFRRGTARAKADKAAANGETPGVPERLTPTGLDLPPGLDFDEWAAVGDRLMEYRSAIRWAIGEWWVYGEHAYGERAAQALDSDRWSFGSFMNMGTVARKFEPSRRREVLSWSHHQTVAALPPAKADELLDRAEAEHMSVAKLRNAVQKVQATDTTATDTTAAKRRRQPLTDEARTIAYQLGTVVNRLGRFAEDDRLGSNRERVADLMRGELNRAIAACRDLIDKLDGSP